MARRLRIAVWYNLPSGGAKRALYYHVRGLAERGHELVVWRPPVHDLDYLPIASLVAEREVPLDPILDDGVNYFSKVARHLRRWRGQMEAMERHSRECARQMMEEGFDLLFATNDLYYNAPYVGRFVSGMPKALYLQEPHREFYEAGLNYPWPAPREDPSIGPVKRFKRRLKDLADLNAARVAVREERANAAAFDTILVNSLFSRESLLRAYGLDSQVCYLGTDTLLFRDPGGPRERFVLGLGTITTAKNVQLAIEAVSAIERDRPALVWVANSKNPLYLAEMEDLARRLSVDFAATNHHPRLGARRSHGQGGSDDLRATPGAVRLCSARSERVRPPRGRGSGRRRPGDGGG